tara:strand:+ start:1219 stop:2376 length:1158 start_codon:yes stop_codon:yes gene_type:complete
MGKKINTSIIHSGSDPKIHFGSINDPVYKNSTLVFDDYNSFIKAKKKKFEVPYYGRISTYTTRRFENLICSLYDSKYGIVTCSGLSAITLVLTSLLREKDEILITENCYEPVYNFATKELGKFGIKSFFFPCNKKIENFITKKTKLIYLESPGSLNFEVEDIEKIVKIAKKKKIITIIDNTWSTFYGCNPLKYGIDIVIESATKYFSGHSDNFLGIIALSSPNLRKIIKQTVTRFGDFVSPESCFNASKGLRTLKVRMNKHSLNAEKIFYFLRNHKLVSDIIYLPDKNNKNNILWKKYHSISNGLITFSIIRKKLINKFVDKLRLFKIGFSWGGYESLILPINNLKPSQKLNIKSKYWFRIHVGLESTIDLINDLESAFKNYEKQ